MKKSAIEKCTFRKKVLLKNVLFEKKCYTKKRIFLYKTIF
jgi:hypothetical protein